MLFTDSLATAFAASGSIATFNLDVPEWPFFPFSGHGSRNTVTTSPERRFEHSLGSIASLFNSAMELLSLLDGISGSWLISSGSELQSDWIGCLLVCSDISYAKWQKEIHVI